METKSTTQEILLINGSSFLSREWCEKNNSTNPDKLTEIEKIEEACWNGILQELLPEIFNQTQKNGFYLWRITITSSFLELELGQFPAESDKYYSLDPASFLSVQNNN